MDQQEAFTPRRRNFQRFIPRPRAPHEVVMYELTTEQVNAYLFNCGHESLAQEFEKPRCGSGDKALPYLILILQEAGIDTTRLERGLSVGILSRHGFTSYPQWIQAVKVIMYDTQLQELDDGMLGQFPEMTTGDILEFYRYDLEGYLERHPGVDAAFLCGLQAFRDCRLMKILDGTQNITNMRRLGHEFDAGERFFVEWGRVSYRVAAAMIITRYHCTEGIGRLRHLVDSDALMVELVTTTTEDDHDRWTGGRPLNSHTIFKVENEFYDWIETDTRTKKAYDEARRVLRAE